MRLPVPFHISTLAYFDPGLCPETDVVIEAWEYIPLIVADAATQMAIDAELVELCSRSARGAFLRFYFMSPPAVTIGRNQRWRAVIDPELCRRNGWDWVRRPTGGGSLLHHREINYAVAATQNMFLCPPSDAPQSVFQQVADGLLAGLVRLGLQPHLNVSRKERIGGGQVSAHGLCGAALTRYEISIDGQKAVAAAQWNLSNASLQHGTIYLRAPGPEDTFWPESPSLALQPGPQKWWAFGSGGTASLHDRRSALANALKAGLGETLGVSWRDSSDSWVHSPEVAARKDRWRAERWHERR